MGRPKKYTPKVISYIRKNCGKISKQDIATHLGVTLNALSKVLSDLRNKYPKLPKYPNGGHLNAYKIGDMVVRKGKDRPDRYFIKTATGFREERKRDMAHFHNKPRNETAEPKQKGRTFKLPLAKSIETSRVRIKLPGGGSVECDSDKVDATIRYLLKSG